MKFQEDFELREKVFRKMGWSFIPERERWCQGNRPIDSPVKGDDPNALPPIERSWEVCAERLAPFMRRKGFYYYIVSATNLWGLSFVWCNSSGMEIIDCEQEITNDNIARAACEAFLEVEL